MRKLDCAIFKRTLSPTMVLTKLIHKHLKKIDSCELQVLDFNTGVFSRGCEPFY